MRAIVILFLLISTLVQVQTSYATTQSKVEPTSPFENQTEGKDKNAAELDSLSVTPMPEYSKRHVEDLNSVFGARSLGLDLWYFNGIAGDSSSSRSSLYLFNIESTFRYDYNTFFQIGAAMSESNGIFFHGAHVWTLSPILFAKPYWRVSLMNTSAPNQTFSSILNYKNLNLGLGYGIKDLQFLFKGAEVSLDALISTQGYSYLFGLGYSFGF